VGLTTALVALESGFVIVGSLPTTKNGTTISGTGCLIVLDSNGTVVETITGHNLNGPWDMAAVDPGAVAELFVTNVLNGTVAANGTVVNGGTVVRLDLTIPAGHAPQVVDSEVIASGFPQRTDPVALVIGPTGVAFDEQTGILYVADTLDSRIAAIPSALLRKSAEKLGTTVSQGSALNGPLGLTFAPNHHLLAANGGNGYLVEIDPLTGKQVATKLLDNTGGPPPGVGALFGLAATSEGVYFVDNDSNTFNLLN
jgi:DNA-binding beta-propeller fold protein YncE